jgi:hypothetical protein
VFGCGRLDTASPVAAAFVPVLFSLLTVSGDSAGNVSMFGSRCNSPADIEKNRHGDRRYGKESGQHSSTGKPDTNAFSPGLLKLERD